MTSDRGQLGLPQRSPPRWTSSAATFGELTAASAKLQCPNSPGLLQALEQLRNSLPAAHLEPEQNTLPQLEGDAHGEPRCPGKTSLKTLPPGWRQGRTKQQTLCTLPSSVQGNRGPSYQKKVSRLSSTGRQPGSTCGLSRGAGGHAAALGSWESLTVTGQYRTQTVPSPSEGRKASGVLKRRTNENVVCLYSSAYERGWALRPKK